MFHLRYNLIIIINQFKFVTKHKYIILFVFLNYFYMIKYFLFYFQIRDLLLSFSLYFKK